MPKIDINKVAETMKGEQIAPEQVRAVIEKLQLAAQPDPGESGEAGPPVKKQFVVLVSDPDGKMSGVPDLVCWVLQIPENESVATTQDRINRAVYDFNASKKGQLMPAKTVGEAMEHVPAKFFKEADVWVKTKTPVLLLRSDNQIPRDVSANVREDREEGGDE